MRPEGSREWLEGRALAAQVHVLWKADRYEEGEALLPEPSRPRVTNTPTTWSPGCCTPRARWRSAGGLGGASSFHQQALDVATEAGDREMEAFARHGLVETGFFTGRFGEALMQGRRADELLLDLGPMAHHNEAWSRRSSGSWATRRASEIAEASWTARGI